jgi:exodeoxyribonuclease VII small subunit
MPLSPNPEPGPGARRTRRTPPSSSSAAAESLTFESAYRELQHVVDQLESGELDLERTVQLFERGSQLVELCERIVDEAQLRVTRLTAESASPLSEASGEP